MASSKGFVRVMVVLAMLVLLATPSSASVFGCLKECESGCLKTGSPKCMLTCIPTCFITGGDGTNPDCKRRCFSSECINLVDDEKKAIECMKSCDKSCEKKI